MTSCINSADLGKPVELWAACTAGTAALGDERLHRRFVALLDALARNPQATIPQACGEAADVKAAYRFLENERINTDHLIGPIADATARHCGGHAVIYVVQDTTTLNYTSRTATSGLGPINDSPRARGILLHSTLALRADGTPVGILNQQYWARPIDHKTAKDRKGRPFEEKESYKWFRGVVSARLALQNHLAAQEQPRLVHVMDREGDIHEVLQLINASRDGAVIRCAQNRSVAGEISKAHDAVRQQPPLGRTTITVPRRGNQPERSATLELRAAPLTITPDRGKYPERAPGNWTLLEAVEINPPKGVAPLHWLLWTTEPLTTLDEALRVLEIYAYRWRVEDFHLVLKSGCRIEELELHTAKRLFKAAALYSAVAVRVITLRDLSRREPDAPCTEVLSPLEWQALWAHFKKRLPASNQAPPTLKQATLWIGRLGGHMGRKSDGMPGVRTLWRGVRALSLLTAGYRAATR